MLTVTPSASTLIEQMCTAHELPPAAGLRITSNTPDDGPPSPDYEVSLVTEPHPLDQVIDEGTAHVYVEAEAAPELEDAVLDAAVEGTQVAFTLQRRPPMNGAAG